MTVPRWILACCLALMTGLFPLVGTGGTARAQESSLVELRLVAHPPWHAAGDRLNLSVRIVNTGSEPLEGFSIQVAAYDRVATRSSLRQSFEVPVPDIASVRSVFPRDFFGVTVPPGGSMTVTIDDPISRSLLSLAQATDGGVFPLSVSLLDRDLARLDAFTTHLVYFPSPPETPLNLALLLPLADIPSRAPDGSFRALPDGTVPLETAVVDDGWLAGLLDSLERWTDAPRFPLRVTVAPAPRLLEELAALGQGYEIATPDGPHEVARDARGPRAARDALRRLSDLAEHDAVQLVLTPYAYADLTALISRISPDTAVEHALRQLADGAAVVEETLGVTPDRSWLYLPGGRMDDRTLSVLHQLESANNAFLSSASVQDPSDPPLGCPATFASWTCPVVIDSIEGTTLALKADDGLQERSSRLAGPAEGVAGPEERLELQRFFAETAMIWAELPGTSGRVVHVALPPLWHPPSRASRLLLRGLARSPWLRTLTGEEGIEVGSSLVEAQHGDLDGITREITPALPPLPNEPESPYFAGIETAEQTVENFRSVKPPAPLVERLRRNLLVAESRLWWTSAELEREGLGYADSSRREAEAELGKIGIESPGEITLTSRRGSVQLLVLNGTGYPVDLRIRLASTKLEFAEEILDRSFDPATTPVTVEVTAQSSGIFPLEVNLETPTGFPIGPGGVKSISVRSTEFNEIAVTLTLGALAFLVLFYAGRVIRTRRKGRSDAAGASAP